MAIDWTYDYFMEDSKAFDANEEMEHYRHYFMGWLKEKAKKFEADWKAKHEGHLYAKGYGWVGDAFAEEVIMSDWFSDFYKDAYNQRPHLASWFYVQAVELPMEEDTTRTFCARPVEQAMEWAREARELYD